MSGTDPSPFRRFPWVQLAFCLACLSMAAWTWMRYSYAWRVTADDLYVVSPEGTGYRGDKRLSQRYVRLALAPWMEWARGQRSEMHAGLPEEVGARIGDYGEIGWILHVPTPDGGVQTATLIVPATVVSVASTSSEGQTFGFRLEPLVDAIVTAGGHIHARIDVYDSQQGGVQAVSVVDIDSTASRFHPASVAGLVVGGMGCFVLGLYLRRWLRERRAAA